MAEPAYRLICGDAAAELAKLPAASVQVICTSPPYWGLRDYGITGQMGQEESPDAFVAALVGVMEACRRVMRDDATLWVNLASSYTSVKIESQEYVMRTDLTDEERSYVFAEFAKHYATPAQTVSPVRSADAQAEQDMSSVSFQGARTAGELSNESV